MEIHALDDYPFLPDGTGELQRHQPTIHGLLSLVRAAAQAAYEHLETRAWELSPQEALAEIQPYLARIERCLQHIYELMR